MTQPLNYATPQTYANVAHAPYKVFHARGIMSAWKGDRLWRIYLEDGKTYFIKVGGSRKSASVGYAQFGLIGAILAHYSAKRDKKKTEAKVNEIFNIHPRDLIGQDKESFVVDQSQLTGMSIEPPSFWGNTSIGGWKFRDAKKKKRAFTFDDLASMQAAVTNLSETYGSNVKINAQWSDAKSKFVKV